MVGGTIRDSGSRSASSSESGSSTSTHGVLHGRPRRRVSPHTRAATALHEVGARGRGARGSRRAPARPLADRSRAGRRSRCCAMRACTSISRSRWRSSSGARSRSSIR
jgi:hypothetical protein